MRDFATFDRVGKDVASRHETNGFPRRCRGDFGNGQGRTMAEDTVTTAGIGKHGVSRLPSVDIDSYNIELKDEDGFLGDRASKGAFQKILDGWRKPLKKNGDDPFGKKSTDEIGKSTLD